MTDRPAKTPFPLMRFIQSARWAALVMAVIAFVALPANLNSRFDTFAYAISPFALIVAIILWLFGFHTKSDGRWTWQIFPALTTAALCLGTIAGMLLLPRGTWVTEISPRVLCASNLRQIGQALALYRIDHGGINPPDWATLARIETELQLGAFHCPLSDLPKLEDNPDPAYRAAALIRPQQSSYIYLGQGQTDATPPQTVTAYDRLEDHQGDGTNVLFADGHVEWTTPKGLQTFLKKSVESP
jgi:prepilin-type processing-associated H-X9-DG protein